MYNFVLKNIIAKTVGATRLLVVSCLSYPKTVKTHLSIRCLSFIKSKILWIKKLELVPYIKYA